MLVALTHLDREGVVLAALGVVHLDDGAAARVAGEQRLHRVRLEGVLAAGEQLGARRLQASLPASDAVSLPTRTTYAAPPPLLK